MSSQQYFDFYDPPDPDKRAIQLMAFMEGLLKGEVVTLEETTGDLSEVFADGGKWRGSIPRLLANKGLIAIVGAIRSRRKSRNGSIVNQWRAIDMEGLRCFYVAFKSSLNRKGPSAGTDEPN